MSPSARREYVRDMQLRYRESKGRKARMRLLVQVSETMGCHRKHAGRLMRGRPPRLERPLRQREPVYPERLIEILETVWEATQHLWSVRLKAALPLWMGWIKQRWTLSAEEERLLLAMSPATMDRRLGPSKRKLARRIYGQTKPGRWLRQTIPIQTESWNVPEPGWLEVDTVSHSGPSASGLFAYTLNQVDLFSGWVEMRAMLGKSAAAVVALSDEMRRAQPFGLKGMDTDNGEEFINYELDRYCRQTQVQRFRSRPYKKDDQAHIEQKNGTHVRRLIGWDRYDSPEAEAAMNALYRGEWRLLANLFLPSVKLANKVRVGSKIKRVYEEAKTPLDRLLESGQGDRHKLDELRRMRARLDPFELSKAVDRKLRTVWKLASRGPIKAAPAAYAAAKPQWEKLAAGIELPSFDWTPDSALARIERGLSRDGFFGTR
jgi:hypothetical protein